MENAASIGRTTDKLEREHLVLIVVCAVGYFMDGLSSSILGPFASGVARSLELSRAELGPIFSANLVGQCIGLVIIPLFQGRLGPKRTIVWSSLLFGAADIASALAANGLQLLLCRFAIGLGIGGALPAAISLVAERVPPSRRGSSLMALIVAFAFGPVFAGLLGSVAITSSGWRVALMTTGVLSVLSALVQAKWLQDSPSFLAEPQGKYALARTKDRDDAPSRLFTAELRTGTLLLWSIFINALIISYCLTSWLPTLLVDAGRGEQFGATALSAFSIGGVVSALIAGPLIDRVGMYRTVGTFFAASGLFLACSALSMSAASDKLLLLLLTFSGFSLYGGYAAINALLADLYPAPLRAVGAGWAKSAGRIGTVLGPILVGWALTWGVPEQNVLIAFSVPALLASIAVRGIYISARRRTHIGTAYLSSR